MAENKYTETSFAIPCGIEDLLVEQVMPDGSIRYGIEEERVEVGSCFPMGQDNGLWRILEIDTDNCVAFVIAEKPFCEKAFHEIREKTTWEDCTIREWLNNKYYESAFSEEEKRTVIDSELQNPGSSSYKTKGCNDTTDKFFLLSFEEATKLFKDNSERATDCDWWLRTPGSGRRSFSIVEVDGRLFPSGSYVDRHVGIRPAFRINLQSDFFQSLISNNQKGEAIFKNHHYQVIIKEKTVIGAYENATKIALPPYVKKIVAGAFKNCTRLERLTWQGEQPVIDKDAFHNCPSLRLPVALYSGARLPHENFAAYMPTDPELIARLILKSNTENVFVRVAIERLSVENVNAVANEIIKKAYVPGIIRDLYAVVRFLLATMTALDKDKVKTLISYLTEANLNTKTVSILKQQAQKEIISDPVIGKTVFEISEKILNTRFEQYNALPPFAKVVEVCSEYSKMYHDGCLDLRDYKKGAVDSYQKKTQVEEAAAEMNHTALMNLLRCWIKTDGKQWYAPYAAFADETEMTELVNGIKVWEKGNRLKEQVMRVRGAVLLNDTIVAMRYADSLGLLERYAKMRNADEDSIRDNVISNFGLDRNGKKRWMLGGKEVTAILKNDLTLSLQDEDGNTIKSIPKRGVEPYEYDVVNKEFAAMKKDIKAVAKTRNDKIFADFLSGRKRSGQAWKDSYMCNPLLRILARLIVWEQEGITFTLRENGKAYDVNGMEYAVSDDPVFVAHPVDWSKAVMEKWQRYFSSNNLKQPFEQVWEPAVNDANIMPKRYNDYPIPLYMLMHKEKHGIILEEQGGLTLKDCSAWLEPVNKYINWSPDDEVRVMNFTYKNFNRQVNHIIYQLDKGTVVNRIKKDDITATQFLSLFTAAQIMDFVDLALKNNAINVLPVLLQYKQEHFAEFNPMDEFTLDLL